MWLIRSAIGMVIGYPPLFHPNFQAILTQKRMFFNKKIPQTMGSSRYIQKHFVWRIIYLYNYNEAYSYIPGKF
jgi:hypothetical protein